MSDKQSKWNENMEVVSDHLDQIRQNSQNRGELAYWAPYTKLISEFVHVRGLENVTQGEIARRMNTKQSVISRFENMGRLPSYDFVARLSASVGHEPGMTLFGDFMAVVPPEKHEAVKTLAQRAGQTTQRYLQGLLARAVENEIKMIESPKTSDVISNNAVPWVLNQGWSSLLYVEDIERSGAWLRQDPLLSPAIGTMMNSLSGGIAANREQTTVMHVAANSERNEPTAENEPRAGAAA